jgi:hypothetical protein
MRRFWEYWKTNMLAGKEGWEVSGFFICSLCLIVASLIALFDPGSVLAPTKFLESPRLLFCVAGAVSFVGAFLWLPFRRHEALIAAHEKAIAEAKTELKDLKAPKIKIECAVGIVGCRVESRHIGQTQLDGRQVPSPIKTGYLRIRASANTQAAINRFRMAVVKVTKGDQVFLDGDTCDLLFAPASEMISEKNVVNGIPEFIDVLTVDMHKQAYIQIRRGKEIHYMRTFLEPGEYQIKIAYGGDGITGGTETLKFKWGGAWESADLRL